MKSRSIYGVQRVTGVSIASSHGTECYLACDGVLLTGEFTPEASLVRMSELALDDGSRGPLVDPFGRCSDLSYFAAGNILRGIETAGWCYREGARTGQ